jgi:hypothetical protein
MFGVKLRNKNAKWEVAEKAAKNNCQVQTFSSSLFTGSLPVEFGSVQAIELARIFPPGRLSVVLTVQ